MNELEIVCLNFEDELLFANKILGFMNVLEIFLTTNGLFEKNSYEYRCMSICVELFEIHMKHLEKLFDLDDYFDNSVV